MSIPPEDEFCPFDVERFVTQQRRWNHRLTNSTPPECCWACGRPHGDVAPPWPRILWELLHSAWWGLVSAGIVLTIWLVVSHLLT